MAQRFDVRIVFKLERKAPELELIRRHSTWRLPRAAAEVGETITHTP
jgi:hypothetical protein